MPTPLEILTTAFDPGTTGILNARLLTNPPAAQHNPAIDGPLDSWLLRHRLPSRPDPVLAPNAHANWLAALGQPELPQFVQRSLGPRGGPRSRAWGAGTSNVPHESSKNWSGSYTRPRDFRKIKLVQGHWVVPFPNSTSGVDGIFASSTWVGLDGRDPASRSLPQIGTGQYFVRLKFPITDPELQDRLPGLTALGAETPPVDDPATFAWWQWLDRDDPASNRQVIIDGLVVNPGDAMWASVEVLPPGVVVIVDVEVVEIIMEPVVSLFIWNMSTNVAFAGYLRISPPQALRPPLRIEGRTADWVLERPGWPDQARPTPFDLADFGNVIFRQRGATSETGHDIPLDRSRTIRMNAWDDAQRPGRTVSRPSRAAADDVRLDYVPWP